MDNIPRIPPIPAIPSIPFLTRNDLRYGKSSTWGLRLRHQADMSDIALLTRGATRENSFIFRSATVDTGAVIETNFALTDIPLWCTVDINSSGVDGRVYASLALTLNGDVIQVLASGYLHKLTPLSWPPSITLPPQPLTGSEMIASGANPAAGADATYAFSGNHTYHVVGFWIALVTDATVADRTVYAKFHSNSLGDVVYQISSVVQAASLTRYYNFFRSTNGVGYSAGSINIVPIPNDIFMRNLDTITVSAVNKQAGDDFGGINLSLRRYFGG